MARAVRTYLGVDGGGSKTAFVLIDDAGNVLATHAEGPAYYLEVGLEPLRAMLARGILATLRLGGIAAEELTFAFIGLPAYGEDSRLLPVLDAAASPTLPGARYRCGNDMVCGWAGALACADGINVVAGTGSIVYGEYGGRAARAGGWGELFGDEGSAYWIAREGLTLFARMSDGRAPRGLLHSVLSEHFGLRSDLDLCAAIYGQSVTRRSQFATLSRLVARAAENGDLQSKALFDRAARELADMVNAVRSQLRVPQGEALPVSYSGGMFKLHNLVLTPLQAALAGGGLYYRLAEPRLPPEAGAAIHAARLAGAALKESAVETLRSQLGNAASSGSPGAP